VRTEDPPRAAPPAVVKAAVVAPKAEPINLPPPSPVPLAEPIDVPAPPSKPAGVHSKQRKKSLADRPAPAAEGALQRTGADMFIRTPPAKP